MIIQLHQNLINKIAAGEVVERPASVLKELIENSIDAGAHKITVNIEDSGLKLIEVIDDGEGMGKEDAILAPQSHTTSKIATIDDLDKIGTMGFRGEALASISAVSKCTLITKTNKDKAGVKITVAHGRHLKPEDHSAGKGTTVRVEQLFHNIPARKKFLKSLSTEYKHILLTFSNYALAYPNIHFLLTHNSKSVYNLPSTADESFNKELLVRINDLYGEAISKDLIATTYNSPQIQLLGYLGHPSQSRSQRSHQMIFLNRRPISDKLISKAVYDSYQTLIPKGRYPIFFLFLQINANLVDVNVHPRKSEVRFSNPQQIFNAVMQSCRQTLLKFVQKDTQKALKDYSRFRRTIPSFKKGPTAAREPKVSKKQLISKSLDFTRDLLDQSTSEKGAGSRISATPRSFQVFNNYIILEQGNEIFIIDQHAAAERVTFEHLSKQISKNRVETQRLLLTETIELNKVDFQLLKEYRTKLEKLGLKLTIFGKSAYKIEEVPAIIAESNATNLVQDIVSELHNEIDTNKPDSFKDIEEHIIATMACHSSIRAGMKLHQAEINDLAVKLLNCKNPYSCPHGRPIIWKLTKDEIEKKFGRH